MSTVKDVKELGKLLFWSALDVAVMVVVAYVIYRALESDNGR